jgi:starch synthase
MHVLFVTPECYPLIKTGGLADVAGALPLALAPLGIEARVLLPAYRGLIDQTATPIVVTALGDVFGGPARLVAGTTAGGLAVLLLDAPHLYDRAGGPYLGPDGADWPDNDIRFGALSWIAARLALGSTGPGDRWRPDIVHLHDWQAALTAAYLRFGPTNGGTTTSAPPTLLTIHNLAFQGLFPAARLAGLRLPAASFTVEGLEYYGQLSFLKAGVRYADHLSTVSPTYAREILTVEQGMGFDGLLQARAGELSGIVNGIDDNVWDPATDSAIVAPYNARRLSAKAANKSALQGELGLDVRRDLPLFCVVSRLTTQKGLDMLLAALPAALGGGAQFAVLGSGERDLEAAFTRAAADHPGRVAVVIGYDEPLSHRLQAGADAIVVPSRFEPCGLTQLYGLRYGTLPVVARVGGLADTVIDANEAALRDGVATGFQFAPVTAAALATALQRAIELFADERGWQRLMRRAMSRDVGWDRAALDYVALYERMLAKAAAPPASLTSKGGSA